MQNKSSSTMKKVGLGMLAGGATVALGSMMMTNSSSRKYRKMANKAIRTAGNIVDSISSNMKM